MNITNFPLAEFETEEQFKKRIKQRILDDINQKNQELKPPTDEDIGETSFSYSTNTQYRNRNIDVSLIDTIITGCDRYVGQWESNYNIETKVFVAPDDEDEAAVVLYTNFSTRGDDSNSCDLYFPEIKTITEHDEGTHFTQDNRGRPKDTVTRLKIGLMGNKEIRMFINNMKRTIQLLENVNYSGDKCFITNKKTTSKIEELR